MVLNSNRKNVAKIAAASSFAFLSLSPSYQLNNAEDGLLVMENIRDGLKSNIYGLNFLGAVKKRLLLPTWNFVKSHTVKSVTSLYKGCSNLLQSQRSKQPVDNHIEKQNLLKGFDLDLLPIEPLKRPVDEPEKHLLPIGKLKHPVGKPGKHLLHIEPLKRPVDEPEEILVPQNVKEAVDRFESILKTRRAANKVDVDETEKILETRIPVKIDVDETEKGFVFEKPVKPVMKEFEVAEKICFTTVKVKKAANKIEKVLEDIRVMIKDKKLRTNVEAGSEIWEYFCNQCVSNPGILTTRLTNGEAIKVIEIIGRFNEAKHLEVILKGTDPKDRNSKFIFKFVQKQLFTSVMEEMAGFIVQLVENGESHKPLNPGVLKAPLKRRGPIDPKEIPSRFYEMLKVIRDNLKSKRDKRITKAKLKSWLRFLADSYKEAKPVTEYIKNIFK